MTNEERTSIGRSTHSRRVVAKGLAWSVPVVAMTAAAPAYAVSPPPCPTITLVHSVTTFWSNSKTGSLVFTSSSSTQPTATATGDFSAGAPTSQGQETWSVPLTYNGNGNPNANTTFSVTISQANIEGCSDASLTVTVTVAKK